MSALHRGPTSPAVRRRDGDPLSRPLPRVPDPPENRRGHAFRGSPVAPLPLPPQPAWVSVPGPAEMLTSAAAAHRLNSPTSTPAQRTQTTPRPTRYNIA